MNTHNNPSLLEQISSIDYLRFAWSKLNKSNQESKGLSNETVKQFSSNLDANLKIISEKLRGNKYSFSQVKAIALQKKKKNPNDVTEEIKYRPLRIAEIKDRLVQKSIALKLDEILSEPFQLDNECSFAYRKGKNVEEAITKMKEYYKLGYKYILEADIEKFFDTVDKKKLSDLVKSNLPDDSIDSLFDDALAQEIGNRHHVTSRILEEYFARSENGIPQGNPLSPLLANIYLSVFDKEIIESGYKMIRYADDFIIMCRELSDAENAYILSKKILEGSLNLKIHAIEDARVEGAKTRIINPQIHKFSFLSIRFDGQRCWVKDERFITIKEKIKDITSAIDKNGKKKKLLDTLLSLQNTIEGWVAAFHFVDLNRHLPELDKLINRQLYLLLIELDFPVQRKAVEKISFKGKSNEVNALKSHQRFTLGIESCTYIWERMKRN